LQTPEPSADSSRAFRGLKWVRGLGVEKHWSRVHAIVAEQLLWSNEEEFETESLLSQSL